MTMQWCQSTISTSKQIVSQLLSLPCLHRCKIQSGRRKGWEAGSNPNIIPILPFRPAHPLRPSSPAQPDLPPCLRYHANQIAHTSSSTPITMLDLPALTIRARGGMTKGNERRMRRKEEENNQSQTMPPSICVNAR